MDDIPVTPDGPIIPQALPQEILKNEKAINVYLIAVIALAVMGVLSILGAILLAWAGKVTPDGVWTVVGMAVAGLVALVGGQQDNGRQT